MAWPMMVNGAMVSTRPGTLTALIQPNPSPVATVTRLNEPIATAKLASTRPAVMATSRRLQSAHGRAINGSA